MSKGKRSFIYSLAHRACDVLSSVPASTPGWVSPPASCCEDETTQHGCVLCEHSGVRLPCDRLMHTHVLRVVPPAPILCCHEPQGWQRGGREVPGTGLAPEPQVLTPGLIPRIPVARPRPGSEPCLRPSPTHTACHGAPRPREPAHLGQTGRRCGR